MAGASFDTSVSPSSAGVATSQNRSRVSVHASPRNTNKKGVRIPASHVAARYANAGSLLATGTAPNASVLKRDRMLGSRGGKPPDKKADAGLMSTMLYGPKQDVRATWCAACKKSTKSTKGLFNWHCAECGAVKNALA